MQPFGKWLAVSSGRLLREKLVSTRMAETLTVWLNERSTRGTHADEGQIQEIQLSTIFKQTLPITTVFSCDRGWRLRATLQPRPREAATHTQTPAGSPTLPDITLQMGQSLR
ncbi:hypothetical protein G5714_013079 [Onychostoma macrolepis]|uniref:Uncharacterized protein n=1 Tax=Onychostoma macrolepis TaxID=369639 RepID=A0A7J6CDL2_9TELE|nr:hypothetical protein G5714_013079 [Onychostoma macrolepis]